MINEESLFDNCPCLGYFQFDKSKQKDYVFYQSFMIHVCHSKTNRSYFDIYSLFLSQFDKQYAFLKKDFHQIHFFVEIPRPSELHC